MLYAEKKRVIKKLALSILRSDAVSKRDLVWFRNQCEKYADTAEEWVTHKLD